MMRSCCRCRLAVKPVRLLVRLSTNATARSAPSFINSFRTTTRRSRHTWRRRVRPCRRMSSASLRTTSGAAGSSTGSCGSAAIAAMPSSWWRSAANAGGCSGHPALRSSGQPSAVQNRSRRFCLFKLWRPAHGRERGVAGGRGVPRAAGAAVGAERSVRVALPLREPPCHHGLGARHLLPLHRHAPDQEGGVCP